MENDVALAFSYTRSRWVIAMVKANIVHNSEILICDGAVHVVLVISCRQSKHTAAHLSTSQKMPPQVLPRQKMPKTTFSQPYITIHVYEKD